MPSLIFSPRAVKNLKKLGEFLSEQSVAAVPAFQQSIAKELQLLRTAPKIGRPVSDTKYRELVVPFGSSGYVIRYRENDNEIVVVAIKHQKQKNYLK